MNLISIRDVDKNEIESILDLAEKMENKSTKDLEGKIIATLFFEPSTRTKLSFQSAAERLGMKVIDFIAETTSLKKGESFIDTIKVVEGYADIIAMRHPKEGSARLASQLSKIPVVNGGDGANQHPTQTLIDLYTIRKYKGKINGLNVGLIGDLKHARTVHSLVYALAMFGANIKLICPKGLELDSAHLEEIQGKFNITLEHTSEVDFKGLDVLYAVRIQKERFADPYEANSIAAKYQITMNNLEGVKDDFIILHPLPKINEIDPEIDDTKYAKYFEQAHFGVPVRMAVISHLMKRIET
ncbi:MAG TPA: aspartate carbamoyltransferase [Candidatus Bilamarchaeaceae archaeon]|nr:aspartate carbamoyltransferase [Candidatus Bilamarchaeaceae archaeon]